MIRSLTTPVLVLGLASSLAPQALTPAGKGCGTQGTRLSAYGSPSPGSVVEVHVSRMAAAMHQLLLGLDNTSWQLGGLPWGVPASWGFVASCTLYVRPDFILPLPPANQGRVQISGMLDSSFVGKSFHLQVMVVPQSGAAYLTRSVTIMAGAGKPVTLSGIVKRVDNGAALSGGRVTLFTPGLGLFRETRADAAGKYSFSSVPQGRYRLGAALRGWDYLEKEKVIGAGPTKEDFLLEPESHPGRWEIAGNTLPHTLDATDIAFLLPDGRVFYCHDTDDPVVFDPVTGKKEEPRGSGQEQGCANGTLLEDGRLVAIGGQDGANPGNFRNAVRWVKTWSTARGWKRLNDLLHTTGRWYPGLARLADGRLLVMGGGTRPNAARTDTCEVFDQASGKWTATGRMGQAVEFPPAALLLNGLVLRTWGSPELYDPAKGAWRKTGAFVHPKRGWPGHSDHSLVVLSDGRAVAIGINTSSAGSHAAMAEAYDPAKEKWSALGSPALKRMQCEVACLPDGRILVAGGDKQHQAAKVPSRYGIVKWADIYDPGTNRWRRVADMLQFREYHAVTILVPDGRVLTTGGTRIKFKPGKLSADIEGYSPPYLFRGVRPRVSSLGKTVLRRGDTLTFRVFPETSLTSVVLTGTGVHTHWVEGGVPRRLELPVRQTGNAASIQLPEGSNALPVGHYLLFGMVDDIPSKGVIIRVQG